MLSDMGDKKIVRSKKLLAEAFFELLRERPGQHSTVKELCDRAGYSRPTFYAHFYQIEDLVFDYYEKNWLESLSEEFDMIKDKQLSIEASARIATQSVIDYWAERIDIYRLLKQIELDGVLLKLFVAINKLFIPKFYKNSDEIMNSVSGKCIIYGGAKYNKTVCDIWVQSATDVNTKKIAIIISTFYVNLIKEVLVEKI